MTIIVIDNCSESSYALQYGSSCALFNVICLTNFNFIRTLNIPEFSNPKKRQYLITFLDDDLIIDTDRYKHLLIPPFNATGRAQIAEWKGFAEGLKHSGLQTVYTDHLL